MSDVQLLREAVARMRALAEAVDGWWDGSEGLLSPLEPEDRAHMAAWHPTVALAVARWLDAESNEPETDLGDGISIGGPCLEAINVARAFLGTTP